MKVRRPEFLPPLKCSYLRKHALPECLHPLPTGLCRRVVKDTIVSNEVELFPWLNSPGSTPCRRKANVAHAPRKAQALPFARGSKIRGKQAC